MSRLGPPKTSQKRSKAYSIRSVKRVRVSYIELMQDDDDGTRLVDYLAPFPHTV